jgi:epsilon-lactone hydrolase
MSSVQAHVINLLLRWRIKRRLRFVTDIYGARAVFNSASMAWTSRKVVIVSQPVGGVPGERVAPRNGAALSMLYLHGGGYFGCSPRTHRLITSYFAKHGYQVFAPDYRLAPEHPFPAAVEDAAAAYRGLLAAGVKPGQLVLAGDSAGGGLALATLILLRDQGEPLPAAAALFSPWTDLAATGASLTSNRRSDPMFSGVKFGATAAKVYLAGADPRTPLASPLYANLTGLPPLIIQVGEREVLRDDSTRIAERARAAGVTVALSVWPVVPHVWQMFHPFLPEARQALQSAVEFLTQQTATDPS